MKQKYALLVLALLTIGFASCKKEKDPYDKGNLVGKWFLKKQTVQRYRYDVKYQDTVATNFGSGDFIQFNQDGTGTISSSGQSEDFKYNYLRNAFTVTRLYPRANTVLVTPYTVITNTSSQLTIRYDQTYLGELDRATYRDVSEEEYSK